MRTMLSALLLIAAGTLSAITPDASGLRLDGMLVVKKVSSASARVIVVKEEGEARVLNKDLSHFTLTLDLESSYLLSFECNGCVTKQLLFDTHTPAAPISYDFPFQVTLEPPPSSEPFAYAGPVGLIRYDKEISDFGYDTDYKIARNEVLAERLEQARSRIDAAPVTSVPAPIGGPSAAPVAAPVTAAVPVVEVPAPAAAEVLHPDAPKGYFEELAPTRSETAPLVHPVGARERPVAKEPEQVKEGPAAASVVPVVAPASTPRPRPVADHAVAARPLPAAVVGTTAPTADGRTEEVVPEKLRVSTIVRIQREGHLTEYRRVAQYYGGVSYFKDGQACSERTYLAGIAQ